ncbi:D-inositol-3-phosphate glycosyltransferase [Parvicella tangerina]|uniref:D-inositol-3-phosphate glycosyltransferase n=2 Tax=Parvicella tangerina TaxID=2829795 RepID=A0A916NFK5_9FLAO|nr:D-inositol-3-phosphate glycosyltransferase [Parvicella tangerina]
MMRGTKVTMFVYNNCDKDARVLKEAASLVNAGYNVKIFAVLDKQTIPYEVRDGIEIIRVLKNPLHYRLFKGDIKSIFSRTKLKPLSELREEYGNKLVKEDNEDTQKLDQSEALSQKSASGLIKGFLRIFFRYTLKKPLMLVHKPLCFHDFYKKTKVYCLEEPSDIYHGHDLHTVPTAYKCAQPTNAKVVYDAHELYTEMSGLKKIERKLYTRLERKYAPKVDQLITVNQSIAEELIERYNLTKAPKIIFNCPEVNDKITLTDEDVLRERLKLSPSTKIVLYQGGFAPNRGLQNLIKSAQYLTEGVIVFMGWGNLENELKELTQTLKLEDRVIFTPGVPQNELLNNSKSADVGVIPYQFVGLNNYYTSPNKLFEYINANVPIAGSDFPELKRVIGKYNIGVTFDPESPESIAESLNEVLANDKLRTSYKANTKQAALDFRWENEEEKLLNIYNELIAS